MGFCKDCKHWESHSDVRNRAWHTCSAADWVERGTEIGEDGLAIYADATDDSGLDAGLRTGPMFGCVKFAPCGR